MIITIVSIFLTTTSKLLPSINCFGEHDFKDAVLGCDVENDYINLNVTYPICDDNASENSMHTFKAIKNSKIMFSVKNSLLEDVMEEGKHCTRYSITKCRESVRCRMFHVNESKRYYVSLALIGNNGSVVKRKRIGSYVPKFRSFYCYKEHGALNYVASSVNKKDVVVNWRYHSHDYWFIQIDIKLETLKNGKIVSETICKCDEGTVCYCTVTGLQPCQRYTLCLKTKYTLSVKDDFVCINITTDSDQLPTPKLEYNREIHRWTIDKDGNQNVSLLNNNLYYSYHFKSYQEGNSTTGRTTSNSLQCPEQRDSLLTIQLCNECLCSDKETVNCQKMATEDGNVDENQTVLIIIVVCCLVVIVIIVGIMITVFIKEREEKLIHQSYIPPRSSSPLYESISDLQTHLYDKT